MDDETRLSLGSAFDQAAAVYAASRPSYPAESATWVTGPMPRLVLDIGAGTGALTQVLARLGHRVVAGEPSAAMLGQVQCGADAVWRVQTSGEALPFADASFEVVAVAGAFHWMDADRALVEFARVLQTGGTLGFLYNSRDHADGFAADLDGLLRSAQPAAMAGDWGAGSIAAVRGTTEFTPLEQRDFPWQQVVSRDELVGLVASRSYVISSSVVRRRQVLAAAGEIFDRHAANGPTLELPYVTQVWKASRR